MIIYQLTIGRLLQGEQLPNNSIQFRDPKAVKYTDEATARNTFLRIQDSNEKIEQYSGFTGGYRYAIELCKREENAKKSETLLFRISKPKF